MLKKYRFHSAVIILLSTSLLFSFLLEKDALANIKFGKVPVDDFNEQMIQDSRFKELAEGKEFFRYYIDGKYPVVAYPNERYRYSGALRELQFSLGGDTVYSSYGNSYHPCCGQRLKSEVDDIYKLYCSWYGNPDSLEYKYYYQFKDEHFDIEEDPYMLFVSNIKNPSYLKSIAHIDNSCRVQTLKNENLIFRSLLERFNEITDCPILLNTSMNLAGKPLVGTIKDAETFFQTTNLKYLVVGNEILKK